MNQNAEKAQILQFEPPVKDADGNVVEAYDRFVRDEITVLCNQTGCKVRLPDLKSALGVIWLEPGEALDLDDVARPSGIEHSGLTLMLRPNEAGNVTFSIHRKGTKPVGKAPDTQSGPVGRVNHFDRALDEVAENERRLDERTARKTVRRTGDGGSIADYGVRRG